MSDLLKQYKGDDSNYDCIKSEIENLLDELDDVNRLKVGREFCEDVLGNIKQIRLSIMSICD